MFVVVLLYSGVKNYGLKSFLLKTKEDSASKMNKWRPHVKKQGVFIL